MKLTESRAWIECIRQPQDDESAYPLLRPNNVNHTFVSLQPSPHISDAMLIFINYIMRGSFDDVFDENTYINATFSEIEAIFIHYEVEMPRRCIIKSRLRPESFHYKSNANDSFATFLMFINTYLCCCWR